MGRPWWYDSYSGGGKPPKRSRGPSRRFWAWFGALVLAFLTAAYRIQFALSASGLLFSFIDSLCTVLGLVVFVRAIASWFATGSRSLFIAVLDDISEPLLAPLRRLIPLIGNLDITPMVAIILLMVVIPNLVRLVLGLILR